MQEERNEESHKMAVTNVTDAGKYLQQNPIGHQADICPGCGRPLDGTNPLYQGPKPETFMDKPIQPRGSAVPGMSNESLTAMLAQIQGKR